MEDNILLIEDDPSISEMVKNYLLSDGFKVVTAFNGEEGINEFLRDSFDIVVLDIMMPKLNGMEVMKVIREKSTVPILIMSAKDTDVDKAIGLGLGADDYISKPFSMVEFSARVKAAIRRGKMYSCSPSEQEEVKSINFHEISLDLNNFSVTKNGEKIQLTSKEFDILKLFITNPNRVFTKAQIYNLIWNDEYYGDENVINVHVRRLREKIEEDASKPKYIKTLWGIGYRLED